MPGVDALAYSGSALNDLTRVAASPVEMWRDICVENREALLSAVTEFEAALAQLKTYIAKGDEDALADVMSQARTERQRLTRMREQS